MCIALTVTVFYKRVYSPLEFEWFGGIVRIRSYAFSCTPSTWFSPAIEYGLVVSDMGVRYNSLPGSFAISTKHTRIRSYKYLTSFQKESDCICPSMQRCIQIEKVAMSQISIFHIGTLPLPWHDSDLCISCLSGRWDLMAQRHDLRLWPRIMWLKALIFQPRI